MVLKIYTHEDIPLITQQYTTMTFSHRYYNYLTVAVIENNERKDINISKNNCDIAHCCSIPIDDNIFEHIQIPESINVIHCPQQYKGIINNLLMPTDLQELIIWDINEPLNNLPARLRNIYLRNTKNNHKLILLSKMPFECKVFFYNNISYHL